MKEAINIYREKPILKRATVPRIEPQTRGNNYDHYNMCWS